MKKIGTKLRVLRVLHGYSQEYVAHHLAMSQKSYSRLETDERMPTSYLAGLLSRLYHLPEGQLRRFLELKDQILLARLLTEGHIAPLHTHHL
ncbi:helix-turn-helix transcriptional regulator [Eisenibacter elegans]|uniref:helix-turn-helix transcriptional regulator n=1 Tax=Eisenibacter elegans TaxID=997 RepID=UPI000405F821|nr:helix-turn-helix transcriptional regulator [Eisenibacter elegans]